MRDFMASRVVNGRQQIRAAITFHEYARLVLWPYGYTKTDVPSDMTTQDHAALAIIGKHMAATNGYKAEQASDLYVDSGTSRDYQYGATGSSPEHDRAAARGLPRRLTHRLRDRTQQGGGPLPDGAGVVPAVRARRRCDESPLRCVRRRPGGLSRLGLSTPTAPTRLPRRPGSSGRTRATPRATGPSSSAPPRPARRRS